MSKKNVLKVSVKCGSEKKEFDPSYDLKKSPLTEVYSFVVEGYLWNVCSECAFIANKGKFGGFAYYCWVVGVLSIILYLIF